MVPKALIGAAQSMDQMIGTNGDYHRMKYAD